MDEIKVISGDKDGADLRREQMSRYYVRCDGKADDGEINDAIASVGRSQWAMPADAWERIFGGEK